MKKVVISVIVMILLITLTGCSPKNEQTKRKEERLKNKNYSFYHEEYKERYQKYKEKKPNLKEKEIIIRVNIGLDNPYYENTSPSVKLNTNLILVNKYYYLEKDYVPDNLVPLDTTYSKGGVFLVKEAREHFKMLVDGAKKEGVSIRAISAYRSYQYQENLYNQYKNRDGMSAADTYSARPGFSEHQTGLCVDVDNREKSFTDFEETTSFQWMQENAHKYGFILRYPKGKESITGYSYESWHYRYVGEKIAVSIKKKNITFDEYYMEFLEKE